MLTHFPLNTPLDASMVEESIPPVLHQQRTSFMEDRRPEFGYVATQVNTVVNKQSEQSQGSGSACLVAQEARACLACLR
jgi:hypothetical protein